MIPARGKSIPLLLGAFLVAQLLANAQTNPPVNQISCKGSQGVILIPVTAIPPGSTGLTTLFTVPLDCLQLDPVVFVIDRSNPQRPVVRLVQTQQASVNFQDGEVLTGIPDGVLDTYFILSPPLGSSLRLYRNGIRQTVGGDYTVTGNSIKFLPGIVLQNGIKTGLPQPGDILIAEYRCTPSAICIAH